MEMSIKTQDEIEAVAALIIVEFERGEISNIIDENYCYFNGAERKEICNLAAKMMDVSNENVFNNLCIIRRKNILIKALKKCSEDCDTVDVKAFLRFRAQSYIKELEDVVDKAVDDYLMEKEYREFIKLLKYFVDIQEQKYKCVYIVPQDNNQYKLFDQDDKEITEECIKDFVNEVSKGEINYDDLLVSSLLVLSPKHIVIRNVNKIKNKELLETIRNVFTGRVIEDDAIKIVDSKKPKVKVEGNVAYLPQKH